MPGTETLTYPYGETPEEVIREGLAALQAAYHEGREIHEQTPDWLCFVEADDLLTVLDALLGTSVDFHDAGCSVSPASSEFGQLRISILAALGVTEA